MSLHGNDATFKVLVNQARILNLKEDITTGPNRALIAVGDPTILDFTVVNSRQLRIIGKGVGVTDLAITTARNETYTFEIARARRPDPDPDKLRATFPDATVKLSQIRDHFVVEGEARDQAQINWIIKTITAYLDSVYIEQGRTVTVAQTGQVLGALGGQAPGARRLSGPEAVVAARCSRAPRVRRDSCPGPFGPALAPGNPLAPYAASTELGGATQLSNRGALPQIINLLRVPSSQQVMLKVRIAELNRTSLRQIGCQLPGRRSHHRRHRRLVDRRQRPVPRDDRPAGQPPHRATNSYPAASDPDWVANLAPPNRPPRSSASSRTPTSSSRSNALRRNGVLKILAEPNLVA